MHGVLSNADLPYPTIKLSTGESVRLDASAYSLHRRQRHRSQATERKDVPDKYRWNLADLYPSEAAWTQAKDALGEAGAGAGEVPRTARQVAKELLAALQMMFDIDRELSRLAVYASTLSDEDVRAARPREMKQSAEELATAFSAAAPGCARDPDAGPRQGAQLPRAGAEARALSHVPGGDAAAKPHTLGAPEEQIAAEAGELERAGGEVHGVLSNADLPYPTIKLSTGETVRLDPSAFTLHRQARVARRSRKVFSAFFGALKTYERTMGATLAAAVKAHLFEKRVRHFDSALEAALFPDNIPVAVYKQLLADVHRSLPTLHRYLTLRKRMLGLDDLRYQDLYVPLVASVDMRFAPDEARDITLDALAPLGKATPRRCTRGSRAAGPTTCRRRASGRARTRPASTACTRISC